MRVGLLWHLHQPDYRDPDTGIPVMPWARLHGLRGYRDMFVEALEHGTPWTLNVVPSLLDQLLHYAEGGSDPHLELTRRPADGLTEEEAALVTETFAAGHPTLRAPYRHLEEVVRSGRGLSVAQLRDLQVWSTLAWFGATARRDHPAIDALRAKGGDFTEDDKRSLLGIQRQILEELPVLWRRVAGSTDGTALSLSAYDHPILPLLVDARHARRAIPDLPEVDFAWPGDALAQLTRARERAHEVLGRAPVGLWPSEGAVSPEVVPLVAQAGFRWLCSDNGVLARSERTDAACPGGWDLGHGVRGFFRDTAPTGSGSATPTATPTRRPPTSSLRRSAPARAGSWWWLSTARTRGKRSPTPAARFAERCGRCSTRAWCTRSASTTCATPPPWGR